MRVVAAESFVWDDRMVPVGEAVDIDDPHTIRRLFAAGKLEPSLDLDSPASPISFVLPLNIHVLVWEY